MGSLAYISVSERLLASNIHALTNQFVRLDFSEPKRVLASMVSRSSLYDHIRERQYDDPYLIVLKNMVQHDDAKEISIGDDGVLWMQSRICVPNVDGLRELILEEVKYEHQRLGGLLRSLEIPEWKWEHIIVDFTSQFWRALQQELGTHVELTRIFHPQIDGKSECTIQILEDMLRACVMDFGDSFDKFKLIQDRLHTAQSRQKIYVDRNVRDVAYIVEEKVLLRVSPMKSVMRFRKNSKLSPRYIGPFEVLEKIGEVAYKHALPPSLSSVHPVFHVSIIRRYYGDPSHVLDFSTVQ
ncbi:uncharacterized protein [Nicotiana sylvestris]|uniref:uncharacterized protein n=1 Tax=Nicotiana sylvestris TaxID=4096 RepID=UPI00388CDB24